MFEKFGLSARLAYNWRDRVPVDLNQGELQKPDLRRAV